MLSALFVGIIIGLVLVLRSEHKKVRELQRRVLMLTKRL
jgi:hypothetical protein